MANPRKFSEKIALHNQKQAEETAAFEEIMREVMGATRNRALSNVCYDQNATGYDGQPTPQHQPQQQPQQQQQQQHLHITPPFNATRAGSLPNVNQIGQSDHHHHHHHHVNAAGSKGIDLRSALNNLQEIKNDVLITNHHEAPIRRQSAISNRSSHRHSSHNLASMAGNYNDLNNHQIQFTGGGGSSKRSQSPYSMNHTNHNHNAYLSPPATENQWRRTNSDSALHQSILVHSNPNGFQQHQQQQQSLQQQHHHHHQIHQPQEIHSTNNSSPQDSCNNSPGQTPAMIVDDPNNNNNNNNNNNSNNNSNNDIIYSNINNSDNQNLMNWTIASKTTATTNTNDDNNENNGGEKFLLLSASLPDHHHLHHHNNNDHRPRSCEVPGINIYPSQEENDNHNNHNSASDSSQNHQQHIPISSNTGSLPDLTNLHFPVPLNVPIDSDEQNMMNKMNHNNNSNPNSNNNTNPNNSPYSNGSDSPYSPTSSHNSNLSPPPPCNMIQQPNNGGGGGGNNQNQNNNGNNNGNNYHHSPRNQSPRRQTSPGPSPSPTASRRRAHHNVNNMVMGNHPRQQPQQPNTTQVCYDQQRQSPQPIPEQYHIPNQSYYNSTSSDQPRIRFEGPVMQHYHNQLNGHNNSNVPLNDTASSGTPSTSPFQPQQHHHQNQFQFFHSPNYPNFTMGAHRSTTPSDSCSAPTSPASQNISPSNSPELALTTNASSTNGVQTTGTNPQQHYPSAGGGGGGGGATYNSYSNQQANQLQHQLERFRMNNDVDPVNNSGYVMATVCPTEMIDHEQHTTNNGQNSNVFYLDSLTLSQFNETVLAQHHQQQQQQQFSPHQMTDQNATFSTNDIFYDTNPGMNLNMHANDPFLKSELSNNPLLYNNNSNHHHHQQPQQHNCIKTGNNQHLSNSSHCTTPQTPSSIPDIILTGPNNLDETLQTSNDLIKDLNNMSSFDSDIFGTPNEDLRSGSFDSFDLDSIQMLHDIETNQQ